MNINIKKLSEEAVLPSYATDGSAGLDLTACKMGIQLGEDGVPSVVYDTQISIEIPEGYVGLVFMRSSIANKSISMTNAVGVIDSDYRGPILLKYKLNTNTNPSLYKEGDRVGQLVIVEIPRIEFTEVAELSSTDRGDGGYGSTDKQDQVDAKEDVPEYLK